MIYPTDDEYRKIAEEIQGCLQSTGHTPDALKEALEQSGFSPDLTDSEIFIKALDQYIFLCENCDLWFDPYVRIHSQSMSMTVCEDCDEANEAE